MKILLSLLLTLLTFTLKATTYYVAPNGSDSNPGTISQPWATWQKGFSSLAPGDILYIRGGNYTGMYGSGHGVNISNRDGRSGSVITVSAYPGETPVLDCSSLSTSAGVNFGILMRSCEYWHIKGLTVKNVREYRNLHKSSGGSPTAGWEIGNCSDITLELCTVTGCGNGFTLNGYLYDINYLNCDAYNNYDYYDNGGLANGFNGHIEGNSTIFYKGCRAWSNSDDGYDNYAGAGYMVYNDCWAYRNGKDTPTIGNGDGFKLGFDNSFTELPNSQRTLYNCISADNKLMGFDEGMDEPTGMDMALYNCIAYKNNLDYGFRFSVTHGTGKTTLRNNISYGNKTNYAGRTRNTSDHNTWDAGAPTVSDADFMSLDFTQLVRPRNSDGTLPAIDFSHLRTGSDLIDAGVNVGVAFTGNAPDLGPFEIRSGVPAPTGPVLTYESSEVKNISPAQVEITFNLRLGAALPAITCFNIKVNSVTRKITGINASDKVLRLTLESPVEYGEAVTFSYTKPAENPLQCASGTQAESLSSRTVVNSILAGPAFTSAIVEDPEPDKIALIFDTKLAAVIPPPSAFIARVNGEPETVTTISVVENKVIITLPVSLEEKDTVTIAYIQPPLNALQSITGGRAGSLGDQLVAINIKGVTTGNDETLINNGKMLVFPNPAKDFVRIANLPETTETPVLKIFDFSGKLCQEIKLDNIAKLRKIPVRLKSGLYITQVLAGSDILCIQKLIVIK